MRSAIAQLIVQRLEEGQLDERPGWRRSPTQFELSSRQIRRIVQKELGVPPIQLLLTRRLLLAKQLLTETALPITEVAFASGFSSLRRFNDAFSRATACRRRGFAGRRPRARRRSARATTSTLQLAYRPPYDWTGVLAFPGGARARGRRAGDRRLLRANGAAGRRKGWIRVTQSTEEARAAGRVHAQPDAGAAGAARRVRALFDLDARPDLIAKHLGKDARLASAVKANPGLRVPARSTDSSWACARSSASR